MDKMGILVLPNTLVIRTLLASHTVAKFTVYDQKFKVVANDYIVDGNSIIVSVDPYTEPDESEVTKNE